MDPLITGAGGWSGFGITGLILGWLLLKHLPSKDSQIDGMIKSRDEVVKSVSDSNKVALADLALNHRSAISDIVDKIMLNDKERREAQERMLSMVVDHCKDENKSRDDKMGSYMDQITKTSNDTREVLEELREIILRYEPQIRAATKQKGTV